MQNWKARLECRRRLFFFDRRLSDSNLLAQTHIFFLYCAVALQVVLQVVLQAMLQVALQEFLICTAGVSTNATSASATYCPTVFYMMVGALPKSGNCNTSWRFLETLGVWYLLTRRIQPSRSVLATTILQLYVGPPDGQNLANRDRSCRDWISLSYSRKISHTAAATLQGLQRLLGKSRIGEDVG